MTKDRSDQSSSVVILMTALDTTWRMFIPIIGGVFAGIGLDHLFSTPPVFTVICLILGVAVSGLLIVRQFNNVRIPKK